MTDIYRSRVALAGWDGGPGVNTLYWTPGLSGPSDPEDRVLQMHDELSALYTAVQAYYAKGVRWEIEAEVDVIDVASGNITDVIVQQGTLFSGASQKTVGGKLSRSTMLNVAFLTDVWRNGRRLAGRSYIGPINSDCLTEDGFVSAEAITYMNDKYIAITTGTGPRLAVYHRGVGGTDGGYSGDVVQAICRSKPATLRSRRD